MNMIIGDQLAKILRFPKPKQRPCRCVAYSFPHRAGSGKCEADKGPVCSACGELCHAIQCDFGIGWYEYGSQRAYHKDFHTVSSCCESEFYDYSEQK